MSSGPSSHRRSHEVIARAGEFVIRPRVESDLVNDYAWRRDPALARYEGQPPLAISFDDYVARTELEVAFHSGSHESFSIDDGDGDHVGSIMYYNASPGRESAELGMILGDPAARGRGAGSALMVAFLRHLWATYPFRVLVLHTLEWNERALRSFHRAGFDDSARVYRDPDWFVRMEARREWWLMWDGEGRFDSVAEPRPQAITDTESADP